MLKNLLRGNFDIRKFIEEANFSTSKQDNLRFFRRDGFNLRIVPASGDVGRKIEIFNSTKEKPHIATFLMPESESEAIIMFEKVEIIKKRKK